jgi:hypothetical protein
LTVVVTTAATMNAVARSFFVAFAVGALFGCGGGGGQVPPNSPPQASHTAAPPVLTNAPLTFTIIIPPGGPDASIVVELTAVSPTNGATYTGALGTPTLIVLGSGTNCTTASSGYETCVVPLSVPGPATDTFSIYSYATATPIVGTTNPISVYAALALPITVGVVNAVSVVTSGVPVAIAFSPAVGQAAPGFPLSGATALITSVQAIDASGATIIGGAAFATPSGAPASISFTGCVAHLTPTPATSTSTSAAALGAGSISIAFDGLSASGTTLSCYATATGGLTAIYAVNVNASNAGVGFTVSMNDALSSPESFRWRHRSPRSYT